MKVKSLCSTFQSAFFKVVQVVASLCTFGILKMTRDFPILKSP